MFGTSRRGVVGIVVCGLIAIAACGGDDDATDSTSAATAAEGSSAAAPSTEPSASPGSTASTVSDDTTASTEAADAGPPKIDGKPVDLDGSVTYATCCVPTSLDPHNQPGNTITGWFELYDRLTYVGTPEDPAAQELSPMLAESWDVSDDGLQMTLVLRDDVTFNDGSPVDADAVKASLERAKASQFSAAAALTSVNAIDVVDEHTVQLTLSEPDAALANAFAGAAGAILNPAVFNDASADLNLAPPPGAGSGPFVAASFEPGTRLVLDRADQHYWDPEANYLAHLEQVAQTDTTTRFNGIQAGDYNLAIVFSRFVPDAEQIGESDQFDAKTKTSRTIPVVWMRHTSPKLSDVRVREAIALAVDREAITTGALSNTCESHDQFWGDGIIGFNPDYENPFPHDPEKAKALLQEAGVQDLSLDVLFGTGSTQEVIATAMQAQLAEVGITLNLHPVPPAELTSGFLSGDYDISVNSILPAADPSTIVQGMLYDATGLAVGDATIEQLAGEGRAENDLEARAETYQEINDYVIDQVWAVPMCQTKISWLSDGNVVRADWSPWDWTTIGSNRYLAVVED